MQFAGRFFTRSFYRLGVFVLSFYSQGPRGAPGWGFYSSREAVRDNLLQNRAPEFHRDLRDLGVARPRVHPAPGCRLSRRERLFYLSRCTASSAFMACNLPDCGRLFNRGQKELPHRGRLVQAQRPHRPIGRDERARARQHRAPHECSVQTRDTPPHLVGSARHHCARR